MNVELVVTPETYEFLLEICKKANQSMDVVVPNAFKLLDLAVTAVRNGEKVMCGDKEVTGLVRA